MRSLSLLACPLAILLQLVLARPPPTGFQSDRYVSPQYATLSSPLSGQRFFRGQNIPISFTDPGTAATEARFSISNYTGVYQIGKASLKNKGRISSKLILPNWVADGTYDFVVSENDDPFGSDEFNTDVVICTVFVGRARSNQMEFAPFKNQAEQEEIELRTADLQKREPHPPKFVTPLTNQSVQAGSPISIRFLDGQLDPSVTQARFVLRPLGDVIATQEYVLAGPNASEEGLYTFDGVLIADNVVPPEGTPAGAYSLVAEEVDPQNPNHFQIATTIDIQIVDESEESAEEAQLAIRHASLRLRSPISSVPQKRANPTFITPTKDQKITTGHHLNISFLNENRKTDKMRFTLRPISTSTKQEELVLLSRNALSEHLYDNPTICNARVFVPLAIANGSYNLVALEVYSLEKFKEVGTLRIEVAQLRPVPTFNSRDLLKRDTGSLQPAENTIDSLLPGDISENLVRAQPSVLEKRQKKERRESPTMLEPSPNQEVPSGSSFFCKIQDKHASSETARFVLRSFGGYEQFLGSAKFVNGVAILKATCPTNLRYDTYSIVALQNSIKKPKVFLDVISTSIILSHPRPLTVNSQTPLIPPRTTASSSQLVEPVYNQLIPGGKVFECRLVNGMSSEHVKFFLRLDDGRSDLAVGNCEFKKDGVAQTMCQIPSSVTPGTYKFVARKSSKSRPDSFQDVDEVIISLANPRGFGPDIDSQQSDKLVKRSLQSDQAGHAAQLSVLLEPTAYQTINQGQGFNVKTNKNTAPSSSMLKFLFKPMSTSLTYKEYVLGTISNSQTIDETLKCPDQIPDGNYLFVIQANDPNDPEKFIDSSSTPMVISSKSTSNNSSTAPNNSTKDGNADTDDAGVDAPMRFSELRSATNTSAPVTPAVVAPPNPNPPPVNRTDTPLGQPYNPKNPTNIFATSSATSLPLLGSCLSVLAIQAVPFLLHFGF
ncbi:hypothetical protein PCASD_05731 [Puccinia coronata f. sp. avenae]|uniref:Uncharacterized protein n=1 Tax=Puccinia coronata f. sp. avenae TaxID=200324 RepID=A0A2N5UJF0_9BASI|nr:hypothetical protein PCASD_05731 [Puccinia coronata f. sp. avenae]